MYGFSQTIVAGRGPVGDRVGRADLRVLAGRLDHRAVDERRDPPPEEEPLRQRRLVAVILGLRVIIVEPALVRGDRQQRADGERDRHQPAANGLPRPAADQQEERNHREHDFAVGPHQRRAAGQHARDQQRPPGRARLPEHDQHHDHEQEGEQRLRHDQVLVFDDVAIEQLRQRRHRRPEPGHAVAPEQDVDHHRDGQPHQVLEDDNEGQRVERQQRPEEERVTGHLGQVRLRSQRRAEVHVGVAVEEQRARVTQDRDQPQERARCQRPREQLVLTGQLAQTGQQQTRIHDHDPIGANHTACSVRHT